MKLGDLIQISRQRHPYDGALCHVEKILDFGDEVFVLVSFDRVTKEGKPQKPPTTRDHRVVVRDVDCKPPY